MTSNDVRASPSSSHPVTASSRAQPVLRTERLVLRAFQLADGPEVERLAGTPEISDTTLHIPHPYPAGAGALWISTHAPGWENGTQATFAIVRAVDDDLLGAVGLSIEPEHARGEIGYWIAAAEWSRGFATEASRAVIGLGFEMLGLHRIQARHFARNPSSGRVMQKLGMRAEGTHRDWARKRDRFEDIVM